MPAPILKSITNGKQYLQRDETSWGGAKDAWTGSMRRAKQILMERAGLSAPGTVVDPPAAALATHEKAKMPSKDGKKGTKTKGTKTKSTKKGAHATV